jgi:hypothetical protein
MFKINLVFDEVFLSLESTSKNQPAPLKIEGSPEKVAQVRELLDGAYGAYGHIFDIEITTPLDLYFAAKNYLNTEFTPIVVEGAELVETYDPGIPEGAVT